MNMLRCAFYKLKKYFKRQDTLLNVAELHFAVKDIHTNSSRDKLGLQA